MKATQSTPSCDANGIVINGIVEDNINGIVIKDIFTDTQVNYYDQEHTIYVLDKSALLACPEVIPASRLMLMRFLRNGLTVHGRISVMHI